MMSPSVTAKRIIAICLLSLVVCPSLTFAQRRRPRFTPRPTIIVVDNPTPIVEPTKTVKIMAIVQDQRGRAMSDQKVTWRALAVEGSPLTFSRSLDESQANTLVITGAKGKEGTEQHVTTVVTAFLGELQRDVIVDYKSLPEVKQQAAKITFQPEKVELGPDAEVTIRATVRDKDDNPIKGVKVTWTLANPEQNALVNLGAQINSEAANSVALIGRRPKDAAPQIVTLVATSDKAIGFYNIKYSGTSGEIDAVWGVVPPKIVGDNFGKTIMNDYYCIAVAITNHSNSDIVLGGLSFQPIEGAQIPSSPYPIVQGSLARRKLTHERFIVTTALDSLGALMTGTLPFFHNLNHSNNFSNLTALVSNPLSKGVAAVWKDPYPDEMARFEANVFKDDKIIAKDSKTFKTILFVEKRNLFPNSDKNRNDPKKVREALHKLVVTGNTIEQGPTRSFTTQ
jgi:hypothetical protein